MKPKQLQLYCDNESELASWLEALRWCSRHYLLRRTTDTLGSSPLHATAHRATSQGARGVGGYGAGFTFAAPVGRERARRASQFVRDRARGVSDATLISNGSLSGSGGSSAVGIALGVQSLLVGVEAVRMLQFAAQRIGLAYDYSSSSSSHHGTAVGVERGSGAVPVVELSCGRHFVRSAPSATTALGKIDVVHGCNVDDDNADWPAPPPSPSAPPSAAPVPAVVESRVVHATPLQLSVIAPGTMHGVQGKSGTLMGAMRELTLAVRAPVGTAGESASTAVGSGASSSKSKIIAQARLSLEDLKASSMLQQQQHQQQKLAAGWRVRRWFGVYAVGGKGGSGGGGGGASDQQVGAVLLELCVGGSLRGPSATAVANGQANSSAAGGGGEGGRNRRATSLWLDGR
jgi:hypothetical protein